MIAYSWEPLSADHPARVQKLRVDRIPPKFRPRMGIWVAHPFFFVCVCLRVIFSFQFSEKRRLIRITRFTYSLWIFTLWINILHHILLEYI